MLEILWQNNRPMPVREIFREFSGLAFTTISSTLDRLAQKNVLTRQRASRQFLYQPRITLKQFETMDASIAVRAALKGSADCRSLLAFFVDVFADHGPGVLDRLAAQIQTHRAKLPDT